MMLIDKLITAIINANIYKNRYSDIIDIICHEISEMTTDDTVALMRELGERYRDDRGDLSRNNIFDFIYVVLIKYKDSQGCSDGGGNFDIILNNRSVILNTIIEYIDVAELFYFLSMMIVNKPCGMHIFSVKKIYFIVDKYNICDKNIEYCICRMYNYSCRCANLVRYIFTKHHRNLKYNRIIANNRFINYVIRNYDIEIIKKIMTYNANIYNVIVNRYRELHKNTDYCLLWLVTEECRYEHFQEFLDMFSEIRKFIEEKMKIFYMNDNVLRHRYNLSYKNVKKIIYVFNTFVNCNFVFEKFVKYYEPILKNYIYQYNKIIKICPDRLVHDVAVKFGIMRNIRKFRQMLAKYRQSNNKSDDSDLSRDVYRYVSMIFYDKNGQVHGVPPPWYIDKEYDFTQLYNMEPFVNIDKDVIQEIHQILLKDCYYNMKKSICLYDYLCKIIERNNRMLGSLNSSYIATDINYRKNDINDNKLLELLYFPGGGGGEKQ